MTTSFGDIAPFSYVDIPIEEFVSYLPAIVANARENAVVNFITSFEVYLFDIMARMLFIQPEFMKESGLQLDVSELADGVMSENIPWWISKKVSVRMTRNKQHSDIIKRILKYVKWDYAPIEEKVKLWNKWTYVRNAIVHQGRKVSEELSEVWNDRFSYVGSSLNIHSNELMHMHTIAYDIAKYIDVKVADSIIGYEDASLLIRELYIREGLEDALQIKNILHRNMGVRAKKHQIEQAIAYQKRTNSKIIGAEIDSIYNELER
jgi:hypothetical protein